MSHLECVGRTALFTCLVLTACSGSSADTRKPEAELSPSIEAETGVRSMVALWARSSRDERAAMAPRLAAFRRQHPEKDLYRLVDVLLCWVDLERGDVDLARVEARARKIRAEAGPGTVDDIARTVQGAALRRLGRPDEALDLLLPLVNKLIDPWARALHNQEIVDAAVDAGRFPRALSLMRVWLREVGPEERATALDHIAHGLERVPPPELLALLDTGLAPSPTTEEDLDMRKLVAQRLALVARTNKDAELAQHLLSTPGGLLGDQGDVVAQLAAGASRARVEARTVGLVLSLRNDQTRRRGADIAQGVVFGLGLPGSAARLVTRDDHGSPERLEETLAALSADGASIIIAGSDEQEATVTAAFGEGHHIPVLLLTPPGPRPHAPGAKARFSFTMGADPAEVQSSLIAALVKRGASPVAILTDEPPPPDASRSEVIAVRPCSKPFSAWKGLGAGGLVLSGPTECARDAVAAAAPLRLRIAAGFELDRSALPAGSLLATAGLFPFEPVPPALQGWLKAHPSPPTWWAALGHDAAVLAWTGVQVLPAQGTEDPDEVEARRARAATALAGAQADLWTTEARGFGGGRSLPRTLGVREISTRPDP